MVGTGGASAIRATGSVGGAGSGGAVTGGAGSGGRQDRASAVLLRPPTTGDAAVFDGVQRPVHPIEHTSVCGTQADVTAEVEARRRADEEEARRQAEEKALAKAGEDTPYPGWDALREEELSQ